MTWTLTILRRAWGYVAIAGAVLAAIWGLRADARRDQRKETEAANTRRELEAVDDAQDAARRVGAADDGDFDRLRDRWTRR